MSSGRIVLEEEYMVRRWLLLIALVFAGMGLAPGITAFVKEGSLIGLVIGGCMVGFVFYVPFFAVLAFSRYRRVEIDLVTRIIESHVVFRLFPRQVRRVPFGEIRQIVCSRVYNSDGPDGFRVRLHCLDGTEVSLIRRAVWSDEVVSRLQMVFGEQVLAS